MIIPVSHVVMVQHCAIIKVFGACAVATAAIIMMGVHTPPMNHGGIQLDSKEDLEAPWSYPGSSKRYLIITIYCHSIAKIAGSVTIINSLKVTFSSF